MKDHKEKLIVGEPSLRSLKITQKSEIDWQNNTGHETYEVEKV